MLFCMSKPTGPANQQLPSVSVGTAFVWRKILNSRRFPECSRCLWCEAHALCRASPNCPKYQTETSKNNFGNGWTTIFLCIKSLCFHGSNVFLLWFYGATTWLFWLWSMDPVPTVTAAGSRLRSLLTCRISCSVPVRMDKAEPITSTSMQMQLPMTSPLHITTPPRDSFSRDIAEYPAVITKRTMHIIISIPLSWWGKVL